VDPHRLAVHRAVSRLAAPGRELEEAGDGLADGLAGAAESADDVPFVGGGLRGPLDAAAGAGSALARAGVAQQEAVAVLALVLSLLLAGIPIAWALQRWLPGRLTWARTAGAAVALRGDVELFALRAAVHRPLHELAALGPDRSAGGSAENPGAAQALAELELRAAGLRADRVRQGSPGARTHSPQDTSRTASGPARSVRRPQTGEAVAAGPVGGEAPDDRHRVLQTAVQGAPYGVLQRHPLAGHVGLLVLLHVPVHLADVPGQEDADRLVGHAGARQGVDQDVPAARREARLLHQLALRGRERRLPRLVEQPGGQLLQPRRTGCRYCVTSSTRSASSSATTPTAPGCTTTSRCDVVPPGMLTTSLRTEITRPRRRSRWSRPVVVRLAHRTSLRVRFRFRGEGVAGRSCD
jgi:hypothetical protein